MCHIDLNCVYFWQKYFNSYDSMTKKTYFWARKSNYVIYGVSYRLQLRIDLIYILQFITPPPSPPVKKSFILLFEYLNCVHFIQIEPTSEQHNVSRYMYVDNICTNEYVII